MLTTYQVFVASIGGVRQDSFTAALCFLGTTAGVEPASPRPYSPGVTLGKVVAKQALYPLSYVAIAKQRWMGLRPFPVACL